MSVTALLLTHPVAVFQPPARVTTPPVDTNEDKDIDIGAVVVAENV